MKTLKSITFDFYKYKKKKNSQIQTAAGFWLKQVTLILLQHQNWTNDNLMRTFIVLFKVFRTFKRQNMHFTDYNQVFC